MIAKAGIARNTFYDLFPTKQAFLEYASSEASHLIFAPASQARDDSGPWLERLDRAVEGFYGAISKDPAVAEFCLIHTLSTDGQIVRRGVKIWERLLSEGRDAARLDLGPDFSEPVPLAEEFLAHSIVSLATVRLWQGKGASLPQHQREVVTLVAMFFFGIDYASQTWPDLVNPGAQRQIQQP